MKSSLLGCFHPISIKVAKKEIWNSFAANWMQLSCIFVFLKYTYAKGYCDRSP